MTDVTDDVTTDAPANIERERDHLRDSLAAVIHIIDKYSDVIEPISSVRQLQKIARSVAEDTKEMLQDARLLRLGILGQVNAGKSSLLNLLLFDGEEVLPKAATPMTASLTHIVKSDRDEIEIEYYSCRDWQQITDHSLEYDRAKSEGRRDIPQFVEAAAQLVEMTKQKGIRPSDHLGQKPVVHPVDQLNDQLLRLVGSEGDLTPLVKSVTIRSREGIPELDIVDTPGINDPIASRSWQADEMLGRCDAVLLLSYAGQFMENQDVTFFERRIPQEGICRTLVIGSKFDSALADVARDYHGELDEARADTERRLMAHASEAVASLDDISVTNDPTCADVVLMSSMCAALANKRTTSWTPDEWEAFDTLRGKYPKWLVQPEAAQEINQKTRETLEWIGNRKAVDERLHDVRVNKHSILAEKMKSFLGQKHTQALEKLDELIDDLGECREAVETSELEDVKQQQKSLGALQEDLKTSVDEKWVELIDRQKMDIQALRKAVCKDLDDAREGISGAVKEQTKQGKREKRGLGPAIARVFGGGYEEYDYVEKVLAIGQLETAVQKFSESVRDKVSGVVDKMYSPPFGNEVAKKIRREITEAIGDDWAGKLDLTAVKRAMGEAAQRIVEESRECLKTDRDSLFDAKAMSLPYQYEGDSAEGGVSEGRSLVREVRDRATEFIDSCTEQIDAVSARAKTNLVPATVAELDRYQERLKNEIETKESTLQRYGLALGELAHARQRLAGASTNEG